MSPVWIMKAGFGATALTLAMASRSVPRASGLAGLLKPIWLSLICRKVKAEASAASASLSSPKDFGTPPESVHNIPVPAQTMHVSAPLRVRPAGSQSASGASVAERASSSIIISFIRDRGHEEETPPKGRLFPGGQSVAPAQSRGSHHEVRAGQGGGFCPVGGSPYDFTQTAQPY